MCLPTPRISQTRFVSADTLVIVPNENNTITIYINWQMGNRQTSHQEEVQRSALYESLSELFEVKFHWFLTTLLYCSLSFIVFLSILWFSYLFLTPEDHTNIEWMNEWMSGRYKTQVTGRRSQVAGHRSQVPGPRSRVAGRRSQVAGHRSQVPGLRSQKI